MADTYTEGVCHDGAAILRNGERMTITEILAALNAPTPPADAAMADDALIVLHDLIVDCEEKNGVVGAVVLNGSRMASVRKAALSLIAALRARPQAVAEECVVVSSAFVQKVKAAYRAEHIMATHVLLEESMELLAASQSAKGGA
jgi:hypothetical protein